MKFILSLLTLGLSAQALAGTYNDYEPLPTLSTIRTMQCSVAAFQNGNQFQGTATIVDVVVPGKYYDTDQEREVRSEITLTIGSQTYTAYTEREDDRDPQEDRDSDPNSGGGWGGLGLYLEKPSQLAVALKAKQEQLDQRHRSYDLHVGNMDTQEVFYTGMADCQVR